VRRLRSILAVAAAITIVAVGVVWLLRARTNTAGPRYVTAPAAYGSITASVDETGTVNPVDQIQVGTQVSGTIAKLYVDYNSSVKAGQALAELDPTSFQAADAQARGALAAAQAQEGVQRANIKQADAALAAAQAGEAQAQANARAAQANVAKARAQLALDHATVSRDRALLAQGYIPQSQLDTDATALANDAAGLRAVQAALAAAQAQATAASAQVRSAREQGSASTYQAQAAGAQIRSNNAQVQQSAYNLSRTVIRSPIDGIVVSRDVSIGQTVAASFQTPTLFVIASSLKDMQVDTSVDEADVGGLHVGDAAQITVPAYPNVLFRGTVRQIRINPTITQNVVTYDAVVAIHDESERLKPGMTATVTIVVAKHDHALLVPTAALLYRAAASATTGGTPRPTATGGAAQQTQLAGAPGSRAVLTVMREGKPTQVAVVIGISDGENVEIVSGDLHDGDRVVIAALQQARSNRSSPFGGPFGR